MPHQKRRTSTKKKGKKKGAASAAKNQQAATTAVAPAPSSSVMGPSLAAAAAENDDSATIIAASSFSNRNNTSSGSPSASSSPSPQPPTTNNNCPSLEEVVAVDTIQKYETLSKVFSQPSSNRIIYKEGHLKPAGDKRMAKKLPEATVRALRDGSTMPEAVADELISRLNYTLNNYVTIVCHETEYFGLHVLCFLSTRAALGSAISLQFGFQFFMRFSISTSCLFTRHSLPSCTTAMDFFRYVKQAFDKTWREWGPRLDEVLYSGRAGAFKTECDLFNAPIEHFEDVVRMEVISFVDSDLSGIRKQLKFTALCIVQLYDQAKRECWQCGVPMEKRYACMRCNVALFCGRECQLEAWSEGHKHACKSLKEKHAFWEDQCDRIDTVHRENDDSKLDCGLQLSLHHDYRVLLDFFSAACRDIDLGRPEEMRLPSMQAFYQNLQAIHMGEWWIYSEYPTVSEYNDATQRSGVTLEAEKDQFLFVSRILTSHCFTQAQGDAGVQKDPYLVLIRSNRSDELLSVKQILEPFDVPMPPQRFLELYKEECASNPKTVEATRLCQRYFNKRELQNLQAEHHKSTRPAVGDIEEGEE